MTEHEQKWREVKARLDALDDGRGPWVIGQKKPDPLWPRFIKLAYSNLGQGFSLACLDGDILDPTTAYAFRFFKLGYSRPPKEVNAQSNRHRSQQPVEP